MIDFKNSNQNLVMQAGEKKYIYLKLAGVIMVNLKFCRKSRMLIIKSIARSLAFTYKNGRKEIRKIHEICHILASQ